MILYKVVHVTPAGSFESVFAGQKEAKGDCWLIKTHYVLGEETKSPTGRGIYCWKNLEDAKRHASGVMDYIIHRPTAILKVETVGIFNEIDNREAHPIVVKVLELIQDS